MRIITRTAMAVLLSISCQYIFAQAEIIRPYSLIYSENMKGSTAMIGNTIMHIVDNGSPNTLKMNESGDPASGFGLGNSQYGNDNENMGFIDVDANTATRNSSSANLILPAGTNNIRFARLYWGGRIDNSVIAASPDTLRKVKLRAAGAYVNVLAPATNVDVFNITTTDLVYQSYIDITSYVNNNGAGTYFVGDVPCTEGNIAGGGHFAGWCIVVAYENSTLPFNSVRIYDGYSKVFNDGNSTTLDVNLTGLNVPNNPLASQDAIMSTMAWEGDANLGASAFSPEGDFLKINNVAVINDMNPFGNFWNGSVTVDGQNVTTKNPNYSNQMGIDIDQVYVGTGFDIQPNATSVLIQFGTEADQYFPSVFSFAIRMKEPTVTLTKTVTDASGNGLVEPNEELTYTLSGSNIGGGIAYNTIVVDTLPSNLVYVPGSLEIVNGAGTSAGIKTDALDTDQANVATANGRTYVRFNIGTGATGVAGGQLAAGANYSVRFKARKMNIPGSVTNTARIIANSQSLDVYTDDGTAIINDAAGPVPVKLIAFNGNLNGSRANLVWKTANELNSSYFEVQKSDDGIHYKTVATIQAQGNSSIEHTYQQADDFINQSIAWYRLKIVDNDGNYGFSKTVLLRKNDKNEAFTVFPNPFVNRITIIYNSPSEDKGILQLLDVNGRVLFSRSMAFDKGSNVIDWKFQATIPAGNYIVRIKSAAEEQTMLVAGKKG